MQKTTLPLSVYRNFDDLAAVNETISVASTEYPTKNQALVSVIVHCTPHRTPATSKADLVSLSSRMQKITLLGSQSLADLRDAVITPARAVPSQNSSNNADRSIEVDNTDSSEEYVNTPWKSGAAIIIDNQVYADTREAGSSNYAE